MHNNDLLYQSSPEEIQKLLDEYLEVEFSFYHTEQPARSLAEMSAEDINFVLSWVKRVAGGNIEIAWRFANIAPSALAKSNYSHIESWLLSALDAYDSKGLHPALAIINDIQGFIKYGKEREYAVFFHDYCRILSCFLSGLSGRKLKLKSTSGYLPYTDSETVYLPENIAFYADRKDNYKLMKTMLVHAWAQVRFGTFSRNIEYELNNYPDFPQALKSFYLLETIRLDNCIRRELPGIYRDMDYLAGFEDSSFPQLSGEQATVETSLGLVDKVYADKLPDNKIYQGKLCPDLVDTVRQERVKREKDLLRVALGEFAAEYRGLKMPELKSNEFKLNAGDIENIELSLNGEAVAPPEDIKSLLSSIMLDFGEIPRDYLTPAGPGDLDLAVSHNSFGASADEVWSGSYHEEGAYLYREWDFRRQTYKKNWTVVRELESDDGDIGFYHETLDKYRGQLLSLRKIFELMRGENRVRKAQSFGDDIDFNALVDARADFITGAEMTNRLFLSHRKDERNVAVMFMVDMSGSTRGWVNDAEREALILLAESLEVLDDNYAIYGFSGWGRKRCEIYKIKEFNEAYNDKTKQRICAIKPKDYTRMGAPIRHLTRHIQHIAARTKLLISISDGKPDDYGMDYLGQYGVEDTRMALLEARREGIHPFCVTIDTQGREYLPYMYGTASYTVVDKVAELPLKISDIYRKIIS